MLILADTSIWIRHFRIGEPDLVGLLNAGDIVAHSVVLGELAVGGLRKRAQTLADLRALPQITESPFADSLDLIEVQRLYGIGLSWGDVQLLAAALSNSIPIWTLDVPLQTRSQLLGISWTP